MEEQVIQALLQCLSSDSNQRIAAETFIGSLKQEPGFHSLLLKLTQRPDLSEQLTQISAIILKNSLINWKKSNISTDEKKLIRASLLPCLKKSVPSKVRLQIEEIAQAAGKAEYPWEGINEQIHGLLDSKDPDSVFAALSLLTKLAKNYEFVMGEKREKSNILVTSFFPKLEALLGQLLQEVSEVSFEYSALILQVFWLSFYIELPESQINESMLDSWLEKFVFILSIPFNPADFLDESSPKMLCKRLSTQILYRFFSRYGNPSKLIGTSKLIAEVFMGKWSNFVLNQIISQVFQFPSVKLPDLIMNCSLKYLNEGIKNVSVCEVIKVFCLPNGNLVVPALITDIIVPVLCKTPEDEEVWKDNPVEYIRKEADIGKAYYSPGCAALDLLETLCKNGYLQQFFTYISSALSSHNLLQKEALIHAIGSISSILISEESLFPTIESMLLTHISPELSSSIGFLRSRACWTYGKFSSIPFTTPGHQQSILEKTCALLLDPELAVRFEAALTIPKLLKWEISKLRVRGEISNLLQVYLNLINQIDSEEIIEALEEIVENFDKEILPFAVELVGQLVITFGNLAAKEVADDNGDSAMAAVSALNTIVRLIETISESPEDVVKASQSLAPVLFHSLSRKGCEYMEEGLKVLALLLNYAPSGSLEHLYPLMAIILDSIRGSDPYSIEKTEGIFPVIGNFIKKYPVQATNDLNNILTSSLELVKGDKKVQILGFKLLTATIEHLRDSIPNIGALITEVLQVFNTQASNKVKAAACQFIFVCIWADINSTLSTIGPSGILSNILKFSFTQIKLFEERLPRTRMLIGLSNLLQTGNSGFLDNETLTSLFSAIIKLFVLAEEDSDDSEAEGNVENENSKEFDDKCQELYNKIKENLEESDDEPPVFDGDIDQDYDSVFEEIDYKGIFLSKLQICGHDAIKHLVSSQSFEQKAVFQRLFPEIWASIN